MNTPNESYNSDLNTNLNAPPQGSKKTLFVAVSFILVIILAVVAYVMVQNKKNMKVATTDKNTTQTTDEDADGEKKILKTIQAAQPPDVDFDKWTFTKKMTDVPTTASVYEFKTEYTTEEMQALSKKLNASDNVKKDKNFIMAYNIKNDNKDVSLLTYNLQTGNLSYASSTGVALPTGATLDAKVTAFLEDLGLYDETLKTTAQYKKKSKPGLTYLEIHRDWVKAGFPILNSIGLLNLPENVSLTTLSLTTPLTNLPEDTDIYAATDKKDGYVRQTDFNTMTVVVSDRTGKIMGLQSNIRKLSSPSKKSVTLLSYDEAVTNLMDKKYDFILTSPSGTGDMSWDKIYPNNKALAAQAVVTDSVIAYIEKPALVNQKELMPYYIFRGYANLLSGYRVNFVASVPAVAPQTQSKNMFRLVKEVSAQESDTTQKQGTFETTPGAGNNNNNNNTNNTSSVDNPISQTDRNAAGVCAPSSDDLNPVLLVGGLKYGWANWRIWGGQKSTSKNGFWYYIPEPGTADAVIIESLDQVIALLQSPTAGNATAVPPQSTPDDSNGATSPSDDTTQKQGTFNVTPQATAMIAQDITAQELVIRQQNKILKDLGLISESCPVRLTGASPSIFVYGDEGQKVSVASGAQLTYADPVTTGHNTWNVTITADGLDVNGLTRPYIYYEYKPVAFTKPSHGWVVRKDQLPALATSVSQELGLTSDETTRALFELNHAASSVSHDLLYVGLVNTQELNARLPLTVSPTPNHTYRYHFFVAKAQNSDRTSAPHLSSVVRSGLTLIEIGSSNQ
ncbi:MAG: hypothetical protein RI947_478 [Candidatus Parcubacteria bacterium]